jgi:uncharacterized RmlC-like cupin family protein
VARERAFGVDGMWSGHVSTDAGVVSGWHHHGDYDTSIYVAEGELRLEYGEGGTQIVHAHPGDFVHVGKGVIHREGNPAANASRLIVTRAGSGPVTVNVDGPPDS